MTCKTCRFWDNEGSDQIEQAKCRVGAPVVKPEVYQIIDKDFASHDDGTQERTLTIGVWPMTFYDDWCGRWQERRSQQVNQDDYPPW